MPVANDYKLIADAANNYTAWLADALAGSLLMIGTRAADGHYSVELVLGMFREIDPNSAGVARNPLSDLAAKLKDLNFANKISGGVLTCSWATVQ